MEGIWLSDTNFMAFSSAPDSALTAEIASRSGALVGSWLGLLPDPDPVLQKSGEGIAALDALAADYKVMSTMQTRKLKTLGRDKYNFTPGVVTGQQTTPEAQALCDALNRDLERLDMYNLISQLLDAPFYGLTVAELFWQPVDGMMRLTSVVPKPREWFAYDNDNRLRFVGAGMGIYGGGDDINGLLPPFGKFLAARHFPTYANPYGLRLLSRCLFPVAFKRGGIEFMMRFAERWGMPWIVGKARPNAPEKEKYAMRDALAGMVSDAVAVVSGGSDVQLVSAGGTAGDLHLSIVRHWDDAIAQVIAGQTLTSAVGENGSYAAAQTHASILGEYTDADAVLVKTFFNELGWLYGQINARGVMAPVFVFDDPEDQGARAELGQKLHATGVRFTPVYYERKFGLADDEFTVADDAAAAPAPVFAAPETPPAKFTPGQQAIEDLVAELLPQGLHASKAMTAVILKLVDRAETPEDLQKLLAEALQSKDAGGLDHSAFAGVVECALFAADMTGRFSARENVE